MWISKIKNSFSNKMYLKSYFKNNLLLTFVVVFWVKMPVFGIPFYVFFLHDNAALLYSCGFYSMIQKVIYEEKTLYSIRFCEYMVFGYTFCRVFVLWVYVLYGKVCMWCNWHIMQNMISNWPTPPLQKYINLRGLKQNFFGDFIVEYLSTVSSKQNSKRF
jgi:hypothetical protein